MDLRALYHVSYGVYVVSSPLEGRFNAQIANALMQVTAEPPQIGVCLNKRNCTHEHVSKSGLFSFSILSQDTPLRFIGHFGFKCGREVDKFALEGLEYVVSPRGCPIVLNHCVAWGECEVVSSLDVGTHTMFVGRLVDAAIHLGGEPMTYAYYHKVKRGTEPETAPTYRGKGSSA